MLGQIGLREEFLKYFENRGHIIKESSSLIPATDPTLLFVSAGMVPFKSYFTSPTSPPITRAVSCQRCMRTSDLVKVGYTARHHTYFEMLGNFSFGDYFKEDVIAWAWEFLTKELNLSNERLWISIYHADNEAADIWKKIGVRDERIIPRGKEDNFWTMGETGPCGPCSEIIYDQGKEMSCGKDSCNVECDCDRYLELWNLVFTQFDRAMDGNLTPLERKNIDTGMGLERLTSIIEGVKTNFETTLIKPIIDYTAELAPIADNKLALRIIADHMRAVVHLLYDGVFPGNEGRGYVLRSLIRRAAMQGRKLGVEGSFLYKVVMPVVKLSPVIGIIAEREHIASMVKVEEERFGETLDRGIGILNEMIREGKVNLFVLYDTYGFPVDLAEEVAQEAGVSVDKEAFNRQMEYQRSRAREAGLGLKKSPLMNVEYDGDITSKFVGYEELSSKASILKIIPQKNGLDVILDTTPFYGESGGQVGDRGKLIKGKSAFQIVDTQRLGEMLIHKVEYFSSKDNSIGVSPVLPSEELAVGDNVYVSVDISRRLDICRNHTSTHLLQAVLQQVLGKHVKQAGSYVGPERLRFDFTHLTHLTERERLRVEALVNERIRENIPIDTITDLSVEEAKAMGAMALFEDEYKKHIRVVKIGDVSMELCGGTHLQSTGQIGFFKLISESGVAAGIRRIEALTGEGAYKYVQHQEEQLKEIAALLKSSPQDVISRVEQILIEAKEHLQLLNQMKHKFIDTRIDGLVSNSLNISGIKVVATQLDDMDADLLRDSADKISQRINSGVVILVSSVEREKVVWVSIVTADLTDIIHAGNLLNQLAKITGGGGGGRENFAQAGGKFPNKIPEALAKVPQLIESLVKS